LLFHFSLLLFPFSQPRRTKVNTIQQFELCPRNGLAWDPAKNDFANGTGNGISLKRDYCRNGWEVIL